MVHEWGSRIHEYSLQFGIFAARWEALLFQSSSTLSAYIRVLTLVAEQGTPNIRKLLIVVYSFILSWEGKDR